MVTGQDVTELIRAVEEADSAQRLLDAVKALAAECQEAAMPTLIAVLGYNNPGAAVAAVEGLIDLGKVAVPSLLAQIDGYNYGARAWGIRALAGIGDPRALPLLLQAASEDFSLSVRRAAARGLGNLRWQDLAPEEVAGAREQVRETLLLVLQDAEWVVRYAAATALQSFSLAGEVQVRWRQEILASLAERAEAEPELAVRARLQLAIAKIVEA